MHREWHSRLRAAGDPGLLALGAVLLVCAPVLPGISRLLVLPALLLSPGYAFMRLLGREVEWRSIGIAVSVSIMLVIFVSLALYVSGVRLERLSLGPVLGAVTALCLASSYSRQLLAGGREPPQRLAAGPAPGPRDDVVDVREPAI
jgi:hypothetical protein